MENVTFFVERYGVIAVFLNVLLDESGLPLTFYPLLAIAGALSVGGGPQLVLVLVAALCASILADNTWYWIARRHGRSAITGMQAPEKGLIAHHQGTWQLEAYATPPALPPPLARVRWLWRKRSIVLVPAPREYGALLDG